MRCGGVKCPENGVGARVVADGLDLGFSGRVVVDIEVHTFS
jgi:hypothetical protein